jgi:hypothetical protein
MINDWHAKSLRQKMTNASLVNFKTDRLKANSHADLTRRASAVFYLCFSFDKIRARVLMAAAGVTQTSA